MLREERVARLSFDPATDVLVLECGSPLPSAVAGVTAARLLLDAQGFLVGVDLGEEPSRVVVMLGRHEDVDRAVDAKVTVDARSRVHVPKAKRAVRADERNPHAPPP